MNIIKRKTNAQENIKRKINTQNAIYAAQKRMVKAFRC